MNRRLRALVVGLIVLAAPPVMLAGAWRMAGVSALEDDLLYYFPQRAFFGAAVRAGEWPLWNPYVALGYPSAADPQVGTWYPPTWLFVVLPATLAYPVTLCLHFALAGWGAYRLCRELGRSWSAALFGAVAFEFCGFLVAHRPHLAMHHAAAWLPLILWSWGRYARTLRTEHLVLAAALTGVQLLVQHIQISIITVLLTSAWVAWVGWPHRRRLWWRVVGGMALAGSLSAVQTIPTLHFFAQCTRSAPLYERFTENAYEVTSVALWVFPMLYGTRTPNAYTQEWWGRSHLSEQTVYASLPVLLLAAGALVFWRKDRVVRFWALAGMACGVLALGKYSPLSWLLFQVPFLAPLRVPARWMLGLNLAWVVMATAAFDALLHGGPSTEAIKRGLRRVLHYGVPIVLVVAAILMAAVRLWRADDPASPVHSLSPTNPAVFVPLILTGAAVFVLTRLMRKPTRGRIITLIALTTLDLASFAAFNDIDRTTYPGVRSLRPPGHTALPTWLAAQQDSNVGHRLWVPRERADYDRPLEVLWPMTNLLFEVETLQAYTPLVRRDQRRVLGFRPWGASERALTLLRNPGLLAALSVRWIAARTPEERALLASAGGPDDAADWPRTGIQSETTEVADRIGVTWPVRVARPGLYGLEFTVRPAERSGGRRWFVVLESADGVKLRPELVFEPADLLSGARRFRCYFRCAEAAGESGAARVRVYTYGGPAVQVADPAFARVADLDQSSAAFTLRWRGDDGVVVYEVTDSRPRAYLVDEIIPVGSADDAIRRLTVAIETGGLPGRAVVEGIDGPLRRFGPGRVQLTSQSLAGRDIEIETEDGGFLVLADTFDSGWRARLDGEPVPIRRTNGLVMGIEIPPGTHRLRLRYWPEGLTAGALVTLASIGMMLALWGRDRRGSLAVTAVGEGGGTDQPSAE